MDCDACGKPLRLVDKYTGDGRDRRTYACPDCGKSFDVDLGVATWKAFSEAREPDDKPPSRAP